MDSAAKAKKLADDSAEQKIQIAKRIAITNIASSLGYMNLPLTAVREINTLAAEIVDIIEKRDIERKLFDTSRHTPAGTYSLSHHRFPAVIEEIVPETKEEDFLDDKETDPSGILP